MKIVFLLPSLAGGGAERVILTLANLFSENGYEVSIVLITDNISYDDHVSSKIKLVKFGSKRVITSFLKLRSFIIKEKPNIIFSTLAHLNIFILFLKLFLRQSSLKYVIRETNTLSEINKSNNSFKIRVLHSLVKLQYPKADLVICPSNGVASDLVQNFGINEKKISVIYNPLDFNLISKLSNEPIRNLNFFNKNEKIIIGLGSLSKQKDFSTLIKAVKEVNKMYNCKLLIIGEGNERERLESLIINLELQGKVLMPGFKKNPFKYLKQSDVFVLSSKYEGLPNSLIQAFLLDIPCIATDCKSGPREILNDGEFGQLVEVGDYYQMSEAIINVFNKNWTKKGKKEEDGRFDKITILNRYLDIPMFKIGS